MPCARPRTAQGGVRQTSPVPVPPHPLKEEVDDRVDHRAVTSGRWPALTEVDTRWRGSFGYFAALAGPEEEQEHIPLYGRPRPPHRLRSVSERRTLNPNRTCDLLH